MLAEIVLDTGGDAWQVAGLAAAIGAAAAFVADLLLRRAGNTGTVELPRRLKNPFVDLGFVSSLLIGALAGAIAGLALTPATETVVRGVTQRNFDLDKLLVVAGIAGLASSGFLTTLQSRFNEAMKKQGLNALLKDAIAGLKDLGAEPKGGPVGGAVEGADVRRVVMDRAQTLANATENARREILADDEL
jgi:hypothetical protein